MLQKAHTLTAAIAWYLRTKTLFQVHSPYLYELISAVLDKKQRYYAMDRIAYQRARLLADNTAVTRLDYGSGSKTSKRQVTLSRITSASVSSEKQCESMYRLVRYLKPDHILELGTSVGISTAYLAAAAPGARVASLEGDPTLIKTASAVLNLTRVKNVNIIQGAFEDTLEKYLKNAPKLDLVFLDGNHRLEPTLRYFELIKPHLSDKACVIIDDIYWSSEMTQAWDTIKKDGDIKASVDLFYYGLILFNPQLTSSHHYSIVNHKWKPWLGLASI